MLTACFFEIDGARYPLCRRWQIGSLLLATAYAVSLWLPPDWYAGGFNLRHLAADLVDGSVTVYLCSLVFHEEIGTLLEEDGAHGIIAEVRESDDAGRLTILCVGWFAFLALLHVAANWPDREHSVENGKGFAASVGVYVGYVACRWWMNRRTR